MMLKSERQPGFNIDHYDTFSLLDESAFNDCPVCRILRQALVYALPVPPDRNAPVRLRRSWERKKRFLVELGALQNSIASNAINIIRNDDPLE
jgi:hypothetical protein